MAQATTIKEKFKEKYGNKEIKLPTDILTVKDDYSSTFCSGCNGYLTKVRIRNNEFEFYHNWWDYKWLSFNDIKRKYPNIVYKLNQIINSLI